MEKALSKETHHLTDAFSIDCKFPGESIERLTKGNEVLIQCLFLVSHFLFILVPHGLSFNQKMNQLKMKRKGNLLRENVNGFQLPRLKETMLTTRIGKGGKTIGKFSRFGEDDPLIG